jgi:hypothetical protein
MSTIKLLGLGILSLGISSVGFSLNQPPPRPAAGIGEAPAEPASEVAAEL